MILVSIYLTTYWDEIYCRKSLHSRFEGIVSKNRKINAFTKRQTYFIDKTELNQTLNVTQELTLNVEGRFQAKV